MKSCLFASVCLAFVITLSGTQADIFNLPLPNLFSVFNGFLQPWQQFVNDFDVNLRAFLNKNLQDFITLLQTFQASLTQAIGSGVSLAFNRTMLQDASKQLQQLSSIVQQMPQQLSKLREQRKQEQLKAEQSLRAKWNDWADKQLLMVANASKGNNDNLNDKSEQIINEYINRYSNIIDACSKQWNEQLTQHELAVNEFIRDYQPLLRDLTVDLLICIETTSNGIFAAASAVECWQKLQQKLQKLQAAEAVVKRLSAENLALLQQKFESSNCARQSLSDFEIEKFQIVNKIKSLIEGFRV